MPIAHWRRSSTACLIIGWIKKKIKIGGSKNLQSLRMQLEQMSHDGTAVIFYHLQRTYRKFGQEAVVGYAGELAKIFLVKVSNSLIFPEQERDGARSLSDCFCSKLQVSSSSKNSFCCVSCNKWTFVFLLHIYIVSKRNGKLKWYTCINNIFGFRFRIKLFPLLRLFRLTFQKVVLVLLCFLF